MAGHAAAGHGCLVVIDTGYSAGWTPGNLIYQHDFADNDGDAGNPNPDTHGSLVTAVALQAVPALDIIELKVSRGSSSQIDPAPVERALQWCVDNADRYGIDAINLSLCYGNVQTPTRSILSNEFAALDRAGILVCAAAGNARTAYPGVDGISWLASDPHVIAVSASNEGAGSGFAAFSQRHPALTDIAADGRDVVVYDDRAGAHVVSGTSFAAPLVAATLAQAQADAERLWGRRLSVDQAIGLLQATGDPIDAAPQDASYHVLNQNALQTGLNTAMATALQGTTAPVPGSAVGPVQGSGVFPAAWTDMAPAMAPAMAPQTAMAETAGILAETGTAWAGNSVLPFHRRMSDNAFESLLGAFA